MNLNEKKMVSLLTELKEKYGVTGVKAEFEAEGTRMEEAMRLKEIACTARLDMTIKVGGCEAIKDMLDAKSLGVRHLVGPMVETPYALKKYLGAVRTVFSAEDRGDIDFLINLETRTACENFDQMLKLPEIQELSGIVLGRVDLTGSMDLSRGAVNSKQVLDICINMASKAKANCLAVVVGGAVSAESLPFFLKFPIGHIDRFETRKVVFGCPYALKNSYEAFLKAVEFEILWLKNKKTHYGAIYTEDDKRLEMIEKRYRSHNE